MLSFEDFKKLIKSAISTMVTGQKFSIRKYQIDLSYKAFSLLRKKQQVIINLPTGTGKTLVANYISLAWKQDRPHSRILYIVPTRLLLNQHRDYLKWCSAKLTTIKIDDQIANKDLAMDARIRSADVIISTPELFYNRRKRIAYELLKTVDLVVVDEFDDFLLFHYGQKENFASFNDDIRQFYLLFKDRPFLLLSATSPLAPKEKNIFMAAYSKFIIETFSPKTLSAPATAIASFIPKAKIILTAIADKSINELNEGIDTQIRLAKDIIVKELKFVPDFEYLLARMDQVEKGYLHKQYNSVFFALKKLQANIFMRNFLFEDMFADITSKADDVTFLNWDYITSYEGPPFFEHYRHQLIDYRENEHEFFPYLRGKYQVILKILRKHKKQKGVIFLRNTRLSRLLSSKLKSLGIASLQINGDYATRELEKKIEQFKTTDVKVLLLIRDSGGRGLDLPYVKYAIFYSPKVKEDTVWQELSRIRSTVANTKTSYFLYYKDTAENRKLEELVKNMKQSDRIYSFKHDYIKISNST